MNFYKFRITLLFLVLLIIIKTDIYAAMDKNSFFSHGKSIFLLHGAAKTDRADNLNIQRKGLPRISPEDILDFSKNSRDFFLKDIDDPAKTAIKIQNLREKYEKSLGTKKSHDITFNLSLEYLRLYLYYLNVKYPYYSSEEKVKKSELVFDKELYEYLSRAQYYVNELIYPDRVKHVEGSKVTAILEASEDMSFKISEKRWLSVYFLAFIIETERISGNWKPMSEDLSLNQTWIYTRGRWEFKNSIYAEKTRKWLNKLWKRYSLNSNAEADLQGTLTSPDENLLFELFDLFIKYDYLSRVVTQDKFLGPQGDILTVSDLKKISYLQKKALNAKGRFYSTLYNASLKDSGNASFIPYLFFAYRGYPVVEEKDFGMNRNQMFKEYIKIYEMALKRVKYNISFRSDIFQDIFFFGVDFNNLSFLEDIVFYYAKRGLQLENYLGKESSPKIGNNVKASSVYLISHILNLKRISSLNKNIDPYEKMIKAVEGKVLSRDYNNWLYLSSIYRSLSEYYYENNISVSNAVSLEYAKKAFITFCRQVELKHGVDWKKYKEIENLDYGISFAKLFLKLRDKYPTSPNGIIPGIYNADKILEDISSMENIKKQESV